MADPKGPNPPRVPAERPGPAGGKRDRNRRERTRVFLDAGLALFLERGIEDVTIDAIAKRAGAAKGSFYRYFKDKREMVEALVAPMRARLQAAFAECRASLDASGGDPMQVFAAYLGLGAEVEAAVRETPDLARLYLQESRGPADGARAPVTEIAQLIASTAIELTEFAQAHGLLRKVTPTVSALAVVGAGERLLQAYLSGEFEDSGSSGAGELIGIFMQGLSIRD